MKKKLLQRSVIILSAFISTMILNYSSAQFTKGNLVILRVGSDTNVVLTSAATSSFLDQITTTGTLVNSLSIPVSGTSRLTISGTSTSEGQITRTPDGKKIIVAGYDTTIGTASISTSSALKVARVINGVNSTGVVTRTASSNTFHSVNNFRSAASTGNYYWGAGGSTGTTYFGTIDTPAVLQKVVGNTRVINIYNNKIYYSTASTIGAGAGIYQVGSGLPRTSGQTLTTVALTGVGSSPYAFVINSGDSIMYVADDRTITGGGIQKYTKVGGVFKRAYTIKVGTNLGARGMCVDFSGNYPIVYATTTNNKVVKIIDSSSAALAVVIYSASKNTGLKGIQFAPISCTKPATPGVITGDTRSVCNGDYKYSISPVSNATGYRWTLPTGATIVYDSGTIIKINIGSSFKKDSISVVAVNSCGSSNKRTLVLNSLPLKPVIIGPNCVNALQRGVIYTVQSPVANSIYKWSVSGCAIQSGQGSPSLKVRFRSVPAKIAVSIINSCADTVPALKLVVNIGGCTGSKDVILSGTDEIALFPNPVVSNANFFLNTSKQDKYSIVVRDLTGKQVALQNGNVGVGRNTISMNISNLKSGIYFANMQTSNGNKTIKIVKQ